ncbi:Dihydrolipoyllysine-residue acetyltransferase component of pyruvate dehydrogenase complex [Gammaproteobacteria bacterium]
MTIIKEVFLPDIGNFKDVDVIDVLVAPGDRVQRESGLVTLETDKATMEVPSPDEGTITMVKVKVGDKVSKGGLLLTMEVTAGEESRPLASTSVSEVILPAPPPAAWGRGRPIPPPVTPTMVVSPPPPLPVAPAIALPGQGLERPPPAGTLAQRNETTSSLAHASPSVRRFARELGVDLTRVQGSGPKGRVTQEDVRSYVKSALTTPMVASGASLHGEKGTGPMGIRLPELPVVDFSAFGPVEVRPLSRIQRLSGPNLHRNALAIPHITQFDEADITELESFRQAAETTPPTTSADETKIRLTLLAFLMKATVAALRRYPQFNAALDQSGENLILKSYFHIGVAVDTAYGLVVPVIREVDRKGLWDLAAELAVVSDKARARKLMPDDMQGGCFTLSSLGGIGGSHFTPIINAPEVAILGIGRATMKPVWQNNAFVPRRMLPLSLSYDHRVIDGAAGARFITYLSQLLGDIRRLLL